MDKIVSNATPLIYLAKVGCLNLLKNVYGQIFIPEEVYKEVVQKGKELGKSDAFIIENAIKEGWVKVSKTALIDIPLELEEGERAVISLAKNLELKEVLIDEVVGRTAAKLLNLKPHGTIYILLKSLKTKVIDFGKFLAILDTLVKEGFRLKEEAYIEAIEEAKRISEE